MAASEPANLRIQEVAITPRDILFACPACGKNLVVDEAAEGMIVECPQCNTSVIVPPKPEPQSKPATHTKSGATTQDSPAAEGDDLRGRLVTITGKLRELQTQRTEINNRLASLLGVVNRGDGKPIANAYPIFRDLTAELKVQTDRLAKVTTTDLAAFNVEAKRLGLEAISFPP